MEIRSTYGLTAPAVDEWRLVDGDGSERYRVTTSISDLSVVWHAVAARRQRDVSDNVNAG